MRSLRALTMSLIILTVLVGAVYAQDEGATITFTDTQINIYQGTGEMRAEQPMDCPVQVGNFRITKVRLPAESNLDNVGLVIPFRGALSERMVDLDYRWGGEGALALLCEVIDPEAPIGFRLRTHARVRMFHSPGAWLELKLGRGWKDDQAIPADEQNKRFNGELQRWYSLTNINQIYHRAEDAPVPESDAFAILLDTGERGSWWIKRLEIKPWPTMTAE